MAKKRWQRRLEIALLVAVIGVVGGFIGNYYYDHWQSLSAQESGEDKGTMAMLQGVTDLEAIHADLPFPAEGQYCLTCHDGIEPSRPLVRL